MGLMNKILLVLIIISGFLLIFYANNFSPCLSRQDKTGKDTVAAVTTLDERLLLMDDPVAMAAVDEDGEEQQLQQDDDREHNLVYGAVLPASKKRRTTYNLFVIYTKETEVLQKKYELMLKSIFKYTTISLNLFIITDAKSTFNAEEVARKQMRRYRKHALISLLDVDDCVDKIKDIVQVMMPYFSSHPGAYYSDALFYLSLGLHRIVEPQIRRGILIDCDVVFRSDVRQLFDQFRHFDDENLFGLAPELTPVYRHTLYKYRAQNPGTILGSPYFPHAGAFSSYRRPRHGYPGLNSGVVMMDFARIRESKFFAENLEAEQVERLVKKYHFRGHLGDQDFYTLIGYEFPSLVYRLDCAFNRQLCMWWKDHGYSDVFDTYFHCEGRIKVYHGNCNTRIPE